jgi:hypothetical protein
MLANHRLLVVKTYFNPYLKDIHNCLGFGNREVFFNRYQFEEELDGRSKHDIVDF